MKKFRAVPGLWIPLLGAALVVAVFVLYAAYLLIAKPDPTHAGLFGDSFGALNTLFSGLAFVGVVTALIFQVHELRCLSETDESERIDLTLQLFQVFRSEPMVVAREKAWAARTKWFTEPDYRARQMAHLFPISLEAVKEREAAKEDLEERKAVFDMLEFFSVLAHHPGSDDTVKAFGFYYPWWRGFLRSVIDEYNQTYQNLRLSLEEQRQMPKRIWQEQIERLEQRLGLPPYDQSKHLLDRVLVPASPAGPDPLLAPPCP